jgi:ATP-dependent DNA helicase RecG
VKLAAGGVPDLAETLCAFGNMPGGGTILLGVDEKAGFAVTGVADVAAIEAGVAAKGRSAVVPPVQTSFDVITMDGKAVVVVSVAGLPAVDKPCRTRGRAYLRQADGDYAMSDQEVAQLVALQDRPRFDSGPVPGSSAGDLDPVLVTAFLAEARSASRRLAEASDDQVLRLKGVAVAGQLTVAGLYGLGSYPQQFAPSLSVTAAAVSVGEATRLSDLAHFDGPITDLVDLSVEWVARNTRSAVAYSADGHAHDQPEIPLVAVRELIANALVHRDLSARTQSKRVEIRLLPDRLVIANPGGLWGVSRDQLGTPHGKSAVNEFLYDIGRLVATRNGHRLIEGEGGGIREAQELLRKAGLPPPLFIDTGVSFTAIVFRPRPGLPPAGTGWASPGVPAAVASASANGAAVWLALDDQPKGIAEIMTMTSLTRRQAKYALDALVKAQTVQVDGGQGNRFTTYRRTAPS